MVIYKYEIRPGKYTLALRKNSKILDANFQFDRYYLWVLEDEGMELECRIFHTFPTGKKFDNKNLVFIKTIHNICNGLVFHVFEEIQNA